MNRDPSSGDAPKREYDVAEAPFEVTEQIAVQSGAVVEGEADDEEAKRRQDAALASTFDPALAKSGKTGEEIDKQKHDEALLVGGAAIVTAVIVAHELGEQHQNADDPAPHHDGHDAHHDGHDGGDDG
jgi:hypothetical protein